MRTGASAAVSAKWLARKDSKVLAIVGAGHMAEGAIETCNEVFDWDEVRVWSRSSSTLDHFAERYDGRFSFRLRPSTDLAEVVTGADVVVTLTPARGPIVLDEWISPGTHIAAVGADKGGDQELDPRILQRARIFVDDIRQCRTDGEINVPLTRAPDLRGRHRRRDRRDRRGQEAGSHLRLRDHGLRLDGDRTPGLGHGAARVRARARGRRRDREEDDLDVSAPKRAR